MPVINPHTVSSVAHIKPVPGLMMILMVGLAGDADPAHVVQEAADYGYTITVDDVVDTWKFIKEFS